MAKKLLAVAVMALAGLALTGRVEAAIMVHFAGSTGAASPPVSAALPPGSSFTGSVSYEPASSDTTADPTLGTYPTAVSVFRFDVAGQAYEARAPLAQVFNGYSGPDLEVQFSSGPSRGVDGPLLGDFEVADFYLTFDGGEPGLLVGDVLPTSVAALMAFPLKSFQITLIDPAQPSRLHAIGSSSLVLTPVAAPALLLATALGALAAFRQWQGRAS